MLYYVILSIGILSLLLGLYSGASYISHPLAGSRHVTYTGGKFWLLSFVCLVLLYLKGCSPEPNSVVRFICVSDCQKELEDLCSSSSSAAHITIVEAVDGYTYGQCEVWNGSSK